MSHQDARADGCGDEPAKFAVVFCTAPPAEAGTLADRLLEARLAACVNIVAGVESRYRWQGRIEREGESLLVIKTATDRVADLITAIERWHSYDVPEVLVLDVADGLPAYLDWVRTETERTD